MSEVIAVGVDGCRSGWIAAATSDPDPGGIALHHFATFEDLLGWRTEAGPDAVVAIDVPIGLSADGEPRRADVETRRYVGARGSSVFPAPQRKLLDALAYKDVQARVAAAREAGEPMPGMTQQAFGLLPKIREVDERLPLLTGSDDWLIEVHPEASFRAWAGEGLAAKKSAGGAGARLRLVLERFPGLLSNENLRTLASPEVKADFSDVLDAAAALRSAERWIAGTALVLGGGERDELGNPMRIVA